MKFFLIPAFVTIMAVPAFADAESFGEQMLAQNGSNATAQTLDVAIQALQGDSVDERVPSREVTATRARNAFSAGHIQLARNMGVNPADYTLAELTAMNIGAYN